MKPYLSIAALLLITLSGYSYATEQERKIHNFGDFDVDKNGLVSHEEFMKGMTERFNKVDTNGDGSISKEEFAAAKASQENDASFSLSNADTFFE